MRIAVCRPQVPFDRGGAEIFADGLAEQLRARGHEADVVTMPFKWYPGERVLTQALLWRLADLTEADGRRIDLVVVRKIRFSPRRSFPPRGLRHRRRFLPATPTSLRPRRPRRIISHRRSLRNVPALHRRLAHPGHSAARREVIIFLTELPIPCVHLQRAFLN